MMTTMANASDMAEAPAPRAAGAGVDRRTTMTIVIAPVALTLFFLAMCVPRSGRRVYDWLISENKPVEMLTFILALLAAVMGVRFAIHLFRRRERFAGVFYVLFALGMFFIGMEEISWGQQIFGWRTPDDWGEVNAQKETTLHNLGPLQGHNDFLRLAFGCGGLVGIAIAPLLPRLRVLFPSRVLLTWFLIIAGSSAIQIYADFWPDGPGAMTLDKAANRLAEVIELYISAAAVLYLWLNRRSLTANTTP